MPRIPDHPCAHPGCPNLVPRGKKYCDDHTRLHTEEIRSAARRGYGSKWQRVRKRYLKEHPFCVECLKEGRYVPATDIDHIVAHRGDAMAFWDESNWQALCHRHHSIKTQRDDRNPVYRY